MEIPGGPVVFRRVYLRKRKRAGLPRNQSEESTDNINSLIMMLNSAVGSPTGQFSSCGGQRPDVLKKQFAVDTTYPSTSGHPTSRCACWPIHIGGATISPAVLKYAHIVAQAPQQHRSIVLPNRLVRGGRRPICP